MGNTLYKTRAGHLLFQGLDPWHEERAFLEMESGKMDLLFLWFVPCAFRLSYISGVPAPHPMMYVLAV